MTKAEGNGFDGAEHHAVVMWHDGSGRPDPAQGGYVVRTAYLQEDGTYWIPRPYSAATPVKIFKRENAAQKHADKLNGRG